MVQRIEAHAANFHVQAFGQHERTDQREIHRLHARPVDGISSDVAEGVRGWRAEGGRIEPFRRCSRTGTENCLPIVVGAYGILTYDRSRVRGVAKYRNGERSAALYLIDGGKPPVAR